MNDNDNREEFLKMYGKLCEHYGCQIAVAPVFKPRDDGTWSILIQTTVGLLPKN